MPKSKVVFFLLDLTKANVGSLNGATLTKAAEVTIKSVGGTHGSCSVSIQNGLFLHFAY